MLRSYNDAPLLATVSGDHLALFLLGLLHEVGPRSREHLAANVDCPLAAFHEAIQLLIETDLIAEKQRMLAVTPEGETYLADLGLIGKSSLQEKRAVRVLIVDDERMICDVLQHLFRDRDVRTDVARSGEEAIQLLKRRNYEVVFLDLVMPRMSGLEVLEWVHRASPATKVIIWTGYGDVESAKQAYLLGAVEFLQKPASAERLLAVLDKAVAASKN